MYTFFALLFLCGVGVFLSSLVWLVVALIRRKSLRNPSVSILVSAVVALAAIVIVGMALPLIRHLPLQRPRRQALS